MRLPRRDEFSTGFGSNPAPQLYPEIGTMVVQSCGQCRRLRVYCFEHDVLARKQLGHAEWVANADTTADILYQSYQPGGEVGRRQKN